jgi:hypothetical protein
MAVQQAAAAVGVGETREQIAALSDGELIARYRQGLQQFDSRILEMSDEQLDQAFLPDARVGQWPVRVLVGHLADAELAFSHRMRRAVSEANPLLAEWDENAFIDAGLYAGGQYPLGGFLAVIHTLRRWTAEWLATLSVEQLKLQAMHPERGPAVGAGHARDHDVAPGASRAVFEREGVPHAGAGAGG